VAGSGKTGGLGCGYADGPALEAQFCDPVALAMDAAGNLYVSDQDNNRIRVISLQGVVTTLAGGGPNDLEGGGGYADGLTGEARFDDPEGLDVDASGNIYVADSENHSIRRIAPDGEVTTLAGGGHNDFEGGGDYADGLAGEARFDDPAGLDVDAGGNIYVADSENHCIRRIAPDGEVTTLAGAIHIGGLIGGYVDGAAAEAEFNRPLDVAVDNAGNLYVADYQNHAIRRITPEGEVSTIAGNGLPGSVDGVGTAAQMGNPNRLVFDQAGNLYVTEGHSGDLGERQRGNRVRRIAPDGTVTTLAGADTAGRVYGTGELGYADGPALQALFSSPRGVDVDSVGNIYVADALNHCIRLISPEGMVSTLAGTCGTDTAGYVDGPAEEAQFYYPTDLLVDETQGVLYVADYKNHRIRKIILP